MKPSTIFTSCVFVCSSVFKIISNASMLPNDDAAVELPSYLSGHLEIGRPTPPIPSKRPPPATADSPVDRACAALLATIASDPTLLSGLLPAAVVRALERLARIAAADPSSYARVPPRDDLLSLLDDVPPPSADDRCGPWRHAPSGYFVRDCRRPVAAAAPQTQTPQPSAPDSQDRRSRGGRPFFRSGVRSSGRRAPSPAASESPEKPTVPVAAQPEKYSKRTFHLVDRP